MTTPNEVIYQRYWQSLERVSGKGVWLDFSAVKLALSLAIEDAANYGLARWEAETEAEVGQLRSQLAELRTLNTDTESEEACGIERLRLFLVEQGAFSGEDASRSEPSRVITRAVNLLTEYDVARSSAQNEAAMLRQQRSALEERLSAKDIDLANERLTADLLRNQLARAQSTPLVDQAPITERTNGHASPPDGLSPEALAWWEGMERGAHTWRKLPKPIRLEMVQHILRQPTATGRPLMTMAEYDERRAAWLAKASGLATAWDCAWPDLPTLTPS